VSAKGVLGNYFHVMILGPYDDFASESPSKQEGEMKDKGRDNKGHGSICVIGLVLVVIIAAAILLANGELAKQSEQQIAAENALLIQQKDRAIKKFAHKLKATEKALESTKRAAGIGTAK